MSTRSALLLVLLAAACQQSPPSTPRPESGTPSGMPAADPGACAAATAALERLYDDVRQCADDSECVYVDGFFDPVPRGQVQEIRTFDCLEPSPFLITASESRLETMEDELLAVRDAQADACAPGPESVTCQAFETMETRFAPKCVMGRCSRER